ncbi:MAG: hypothetical protein OES38_06985, partial [Gammaproteobacteria bacterium]|nr:hypothetical protein [Gammaproteobacteria bacterium]
WVVSSAPGKIVSGLPAHEILTWIARETGQHVRYADAQSRLIATTETMQGPELRLSPGQALSQLRATYGSIEVDDSQGAELLVRTRNQQDQN